MPILLFIFFPAFCPTSPSPHFTSALLYFLPHLHLSILFSPHSPHTPLCPLTLNHRWTKQWAVSRGIKTNNPVTWRAAVLSRSCGNQALRSLGPSSHKSQKAMIQFTDGRIKQLIHTHTHTVTQKWKHQEAFLSEHLLPLLPHSQLPLPHPSAGGMELIGDIDSQ